MATYTGFQVSATFTGDVDANRPHTADTLGTLVLVSTKVDELPPQSPLMSGFIIKPPTPRVSVPPV